MATTEHNEKQGSDSSAITITQQEPCRDVIPKSDAVLEETGISSEEPSNDNVEYSVFTESQKQFIVFIASWAGFFSPVSSQIYYPALNSLAQDLNVSHSLINLTLTSYMVKSLSSPEPPPV